MTSTIKEPPLVNAIAIIGEEDIVIGFKSFGFKVYVPDEIYTMEKILDEILKAKYAVCLIQEDIYPDYKDEINSYKNLTFPIFLPFAKDANTKLLEKLVKDIRLKATGKV